VAVTVPQNDQQRLAGLSRNYWLSTMKNNLSNHNLVLEDATELALGWPLWRLMAAGRAMVQAEQ